MEIKSKSLSSPIATGRTAEVYAWLEGQVLKLFFDWLGTEAVETEYRISQAVAACGLPVPRVDEKIIVNGRQGLVFERVTGESMSAALLKDPMRGESYVRRMAELHADIHNKTIGGEFPTQRQRLRAKLNRAKALSSTLRKRILTALDQMPEGEQLCHNDFHPENILVNAAGAVVIDWVDADRGNPLADVARTTIILLGEAECGIGRDPELKKFIRGMNQLYLQHYFSLRPGGEDEYQRWFPIIAAARLSENIAEQKDWLLALAEKI